MSEHLRDDRLTWTDRLARWLVNGKASRDAAWARDLSARATATDYSGIKPLLKSAYRRIKLCASRGERSAWYPFDDVGKSDTTPGKIKAAAEALRREGYKVTWNESPAYGTPRWEVEW
jgi:hypothetical protein